MRVREARGTQRRSMTAPPRRVDVDQRQVLVWVPSHSFKTATKGNGQEPPLEKRHAHGRDLLAYYYISLSINTIIIVSISIRVSIISIMFIIIVAGAGEAQVANRIGHVRRFV